jgi:hypothetical protein
MTAVDGDRRVTHGTVLWSTEAGFASLLLTATAKGMTVGSTVVVTGAAQPVAAVSEALRRAGAEVIAVDDLGKLEAAFAGIPPGSLDGYVQMPVHVAARGATVVERVRNFLDDGLLARFAAASTIMPAMSDEARVVLVGGNTLVEASTPDDHSARLALLGVLAHAIQADKSSTGIDVRVLPHDELVEQIAGVALGAEPTREQTLAEMLSREPPMSFDDWRIEVMGLVNGEF